MFFIKAFLLMKAYWFAYTSKYKKHKKHEHRVSRKNACNN